MSARRTYREAREEHALINQRWRDGVGQRPVSFEPWWKRTGGLGSMYADSQPAQSVPVVGADPAPIDTTRLPPVPATPPPPPVDPVARHAEARRVATLREEHGRLLEMLQEERARNAFLRELGATSEPPRIVQIGRAHV